MFHRAIVQSGFALMDLPAGSMFPGVPAVPWYGWRSTAEVEALGAAAASQLGCADPATALDCLRGLPVERLFAHAQPFQPYAFGNPVLPDDPDTALRAGRFHRVPVLAGSTRDEHRLFVGLFRVLAGRPVTADQYPTLLAEAFGEHAGTIQDRYPLSAYPSPAVAWATVLTDRMWARSTSAARGVPRRRGALPVPRRQVPVRRHPRPAGPVRPAAAVLGPGLPSWLRFDGAQAAPYVQSLAPGGGGIGPVDYAAEHQLGFWEAAGPSPGLG